MEGLIYSILILFSGLSVAADISGSDVEYTEPINNHIEFAIIKGRSCVECHSDLMANKRKHQPAVEDCLKCHVNNTNNHPQKGIESFNLAGEKTELCFTCHTGLRDKKNLHKPSKDGQCVNCHSPHSSKNKKLVLEKKSAKLCSKCHSMEIDGDDVVHNPVKSGRCHKCHDSHQSDFKAFLKIDMPDLCYKCHDAVAEEMNLKRVHAPAKKDCFKCHDAHNAKESYLLTDSVPDLCYTCHSDIKTKKNIHQPAADGKCLTCHNTHGSKNKKLLVDKNSNKMCSQCHQLDIKEDYNVHNPVSSGRCHKCHDSHQSDFSAFLKADKDDLCFRCHSEMKERKDTAAFVHKSLDVKQKCSNCHSPHASKEPAFLLMNEKEMCLTCHNRAFVSKKGRVENIKQLLKRSKTIHAPVKDGCIKCHDPHTSEIYSLLVDKLPEGEYAYAETKNFALCFKCHNSAILETPYSDTITNFRNGKENMHYVHIQGRKGRNCKICHNVHGSENEHLINLTAGFGDWEMNMNYKLTQDGGSCNTGCHGEKEYNRKQKFINNPDFDITSIKKYSDYIEEFRKVEEQKNVKKEIVEIKKREQKIIAEDKLEKDNSMEKKVVLVEEKIIADTVQENIVAKADVEKNSKEDGIVEKDTIIKEEEIVVAEKILNVDTIDKKELVDTEVEKMIGITEKIKEESDTKEENIKVVEDNFITYTAVKKEEKATEVKKENVYSEVAKESTDNKQQRVAKNGLNKKGEDVIKEHTKNKTETKTHVVFNFEYASVTLNDETEAKAINLVEQLKKNPNSKIEIHGHADTFGSNKVNYLISKNRAESIKRILVANGIDSSKIKIKYHGSMQPSASNLTDEGRAENRRVEVFVKN